MPDPDRRPAADRFPWHPEPDLVDFTGATTGRAALEMLGAAAWHAALDELFEDGLRRVTTPQSYPELRRSFFGERAAPAAAPARPTPAPDVLREYRERLGGRQFSSQHPRQFAYFTPPPLAMSVVGELLAQIANQGIDVWHSGPAGAFVEEEVVTWLRDLVGFGRDGFGVLTSGGVMANLMGLTIARDVHLGKLRAGKSDAGSSGAGFSGRTGEPPRGAALEGVRVYASDQAHFSIGRSLDVLGFPAATLRVVQSDDRFRLRGSAVEAAIRDDLAGGALPLAIAAVAGSTNTGSVDAVPELAELAARYDLWLHVDAAYGGAARLSPSAAGHVPGLERADSLTIDPHKWFFQAYDIGALLVRRREDLTATFHRAPEYYRAGEHEQADREAGGDGGPLHWYQHSIEGTRRFRALKLWLSWKHLGTEGLARLVEANLELAAHLAERCAEADDLEALPAQPELSVVCFRHLPGGRRVVERAIAGGSLAVEDLDRYEDALQRALEVSGEGWLSTTRLRDPSSGRTGTWLRAGIVNYLATDADIDAVLAALRRLSAEAARSVGMTIRP